MTAFDNGTPSGEGDLPFRPDMLPQYTSHTAENTVSRRKYIESIKKEHVIQPFVYHFLQLIGLYPRSTLNNDKVVTVDFSHCKTTHKLPIKTGPLIATICIAGVTVLGGVTIIIDYWMVHKIQMTKLEFFSLIDFVFTFSEFVQAISIFLLMVWNSDKLIPLIAAIEDYLNKTISGKEIKKIQRVTFIFLIWHIACHISLIVSAYKYGDSLNKGSKPPTNWTSKISYPSPQWGVSIPIYGIMIFSAICKAVTANYLSVPQFLLVILVLAMARACSHIKKDMEGLTQLRTVECQNFVLRKSRLQFRKIKGLVNRINDVFSAVALVSCLRDLMTCISLTATLLSRIDQDDEESNEAFWTRYYEEQFGLVFVYSQSAVGLGNAIFRLSALLYCCAKEADIREKVQCFHAMVTEEEVDKECLIFLEELSGNNTAISGGGFFYITKEYLATMIGLLFTYIILIYQNRDSKGDMLELIKSTEFRTRLAELSRDLNRAVTVAVKNCTKVAKGEHDGDNDDDT